MAHRFPPCAVDILPLLDVLRVHYGFLVPDAYTTDPRMMVLSTTPKGLKTVDQAMANLAVKHF
jgi:hypothetical protein